MPPCTPPRGASRNGARAAARTSRLAAAWVLLLLLVVAAAAVPAHAGDAGDTSPVCADTSCYTLAQATDTTTAMSDLALSIQGLANYWGFYNSDNFCGYTGVTCRKSGVTVVASSLQLTGSLPEVTDPDSSDSMLVSLDLSKNPGIVGTVPASWWKSAALRRFVMSGTTVGGSLPSEWSALSQLQEVDLSDAPVSGALPASWSSMTQLETLLLNATAVYGTLPPVWSSMTALKSLALYSTYVSGNLPATWSSMQQLETLLLKETRVSGTLPATWGALSSLRTLDLSGTDVSGTVPESWGALSSLRKLDLSATTITGCLRSALVEKNGLTEAGVGLTSASSQNCRTTTAPSTPRPSSSGNSPDWMIPVAVVALWWSSALLW